MKSLKKALSIVLAVAMLFTVAVAVSVTSKADDEVAYAFSSAKWDWWGCSQGDAGQNNSALTRNYADGYLTYDVSGSDFKQIQDKWQTMPAGDFYINFTNNTSQSVEVKIVTSATLFDKWVGANSTTKIEFTNPSASGFSIFVMNWNVSIPVGTGLFTFSPIYYQPTVEGYYKWNLYSNKFSINSGATLAGGFNTQYSSAGTYFVSLDNAVGATATLTSLSTVKSGVYSAKLYARTTGNRASIDVFINDTKVASDLYTGQNGSNSMDYGFDLSNIEILAEDQPITLTITVTDTSQSGNLYLNSLELTKISEETTNPADNEVLYKFIADNHNYTKTEGCNPNNNWAWGTFATTSFDYNSDGSVVVNTTADSYDKFRQFNSNWKNVPVITDTAYIDITNNSNRKLKVKVTTSGYTTPADSDLPTVDAGATITLELGELSGGSLQILLLDAYGADQITCKDAIFTFSGIYKKAEEPTAPTLYDVTLDGNTEQVSAGSEYYLPTNDDSNFVGFCDGTKFYSSGETIIVNESVSLTSVYLTISMNNGASIRYSDPTGMRFYSNVDKDELAALEDLGATVQLGTMIAPKDLLDSNNLDFNLADGKYVTVSYDSRKWFAEDDFSGFVGSIAKIKTENLNREFVGRGYAIVKLGEFEKTIYADYAEYDIQNNTRTICYIAYSIKNSSVYASLSEEQKAIVDSFESKYVNS